MNSRKPRREPPDEGEILIREMGIGYQLRRSFMALHRRLRADAAPHGITPDQYVVLWVLNAWGPQTQRELYERTYSDGNTMVQMLRRMEAKGWISRAPDPRDGRAVRVSLTPRGQTLRKRIFSLARRNHAVALKGFSGPEREALVEYLFRFYKALHR